MPPDPVKSQRLLLECPQSIERWRSPGAVDFWKDHPSDGHIAGDDGRGESVRSYTNVVPPFDS
jgi:hypothetical protein